MSNKEKTPLEKLQEFIDKTTLLSNRGIIIPRSRRKHLINSVLSQGLSDDEMIELFKKTYPNQIKDKLDWNVQKWSANDMLEFASDVIEQLTKRKT